MGLGYEGWVKVDDRYALGTGVSVPRARPRLESAAGYGGRIREPVDEIGIGLPYNYDYDINDGSVSFQPNLTFFKDVVMDWIFDRQSAKEVWFSTRYENEQIHENSFWNSIGISANPESAIDGSVGFVSLTRNSYSYGEWDNKSGSKKGNSGSGGTLLCPSTVFPSQLNPDAVNTVPIPGWNTRITKAGGEIDFIDWSLNFSQDVVKFFACEYNTEPKPPKYLAVGPMNVVFSGAYIGQTFLGDSIAELLITIAPTNSAPSKLKLKRCENNTEQDDLQPPDGVTALNVEYAVYELEDVT